MIRCGVGVFRSASLQLELYYLFLDMSSCYHIFYANAGMFDSLATIYYIMVYDYFACRVIGYLLFDLEENQPESG